MSVIRLKDSNWEKYKNDVESIEKHAEYPLGDDFFRIDHGPRYFAFFERLGNVHYYGWRDQLGKIIAVGAGVLRRLDGVGFPKAWYLCDLKVHPAHRGQHLPLRIFRRVFFFNYLKCSRAYAISMNNGLKTKNKVSRLFRNFKWVQFADDQFLEIWSLDYEQIQVALPLIEAQRGTTTFLALTGVKDLILSRTQKPLPILHAQFGPLAQSAGGKPTVGAIHMLCTPADDQLSKELKKSGFKVNTTATIISYRMNATDWSWVLTSDI